MSFSIGSMCISDALFSIPVFIIVSTIFVISFELAPKSSVVSTSRLSNVDKILFENDIYFSIEYPLCNSINLICSTTFGSFTSEKHTLTFPFISSNGMTLFFLAVSIDIYFDILTSSGRIIITFSPKISLIACTNFFSSIVPISAKASPIFVLGCSF